MTPAVAEYDTAVLEGVEPYRQDYQASMESCPPLMPVTQPTPGRKNLLEEVRVIARKLGFKQLMPWQEYVIRVATELLPNGRLAYRYVIVTVPRQSGKSEGVMFPVVLHRMLVWREQPQRCVWVAQSFMENEDMWHGYLKLLIEQSRLDQTEGLMVQKGISPGLYIQKQGRKTADTTKSYCRLVTSSKIAGHGGKPGLVMIDEAWTMTEAQAQAFIPSQRTKPNAQVWFVSSVGDDSSVFFRDKYDEGRQLAERGVNRGTAFFNWGAPDGAPPDDRRVWVRAMPALGWTTSMDVLDTEFQVTPEREWRRSALNQWVEGYGDPLFPAQVWDDVFEGHDLEPEGDMIYLAVDVPPERTHGSVVLCGSSVLALEEYKKGLGWITGDVRAAVRYMETQGDRVTVAAVDSPTMRPLIEPLEAEGVQVRWYDNKAYMRGCGRFHDGVMDGRLKVMGSSELRTSGYGAYRHDREGGFVWRRYDDTVDISPLVAATLAWDMMISDLEGFGSIKEFYQRLDQAAPDQDDVQFWA